MPKVSNTKEKYNNDRMLLVVVKLERLKLDMGYLKTKWPNNKK